MAKDIRTILVTLRDVVDDILRVDCEGSGLVTFERFTLVAWATEALAGALYFLALLENEKI